MDNIAHILVAYLLKNKLLFLLYRCDRGIEFLFPATQMHYYSILESIAHETSRILLQQIQLYPSVWIQFYFALKFSIDKFTIWREQGRKAFRLLEWWMRAVEGDFIVQKCTWTYFFCLLIIPLMSNVLFIIITITINIVIIISNYAIGKTKLQSISCWWGKFMAFR